MNASGSDLLNAVRQPEYTGDNRCLPCTVINAGIAVIVSSIVGVLISIWIGVVAFVAFLGTIYLRGYLIPGTPTLTKRYLPDRVHRLLGTDYVERPESAVDLVAESDGGTSTAGSSSDTRPAADDDTGTLLYEEGIVTECPDEDDLCLASAFHESWRNRIVRIREKGNGATRLAAHLDVDPAALDLEDRADEYAVIYEGERVDAWLSEAAFLADMAAEPTLSAWCSDWEDLDPMARTRIIASLRAFLEQCPSCDSDLETAESAWETCCREGTSVSVECEACGDLVFSGRY